MQSPRSDTVLPANRPLLRPYTTPEPTLPLRVLQRRYAPLQMNLDLFRRG